MYDAVLDRRTNRENYKFGLRLVGRRIVSTAATAGVQVAGPNARRVALWISASPSARLTLNLGNAGAADGQGFVLSTTSPPLLLTSENVGHLIAAEVYVYSSAGTPVVYLHEVSLEADD